MALVMYIKPGCPYCQRARDYYNENGTEFTEYDAQNEKRHQHEMLRVTGGDPTVPAIVKDGVHVQSGWGEPPRG
jgi:glutaredoxin